MPVPFVVMLFILALSFVSAQPKYYVDETNTTYWAFGDSRQLYQDSDAYGGYYHYCQPNTTSCFGRFAFQGTSFEIFGIQDKVNEPQTKCRIDFRWLSGSATHQYSRGSPPIYNISFAYGDGFSADTISYVSFIAQDACYTILDYVAVSAGSVTGFGARLRRVSLHDSSGNSSTNPPPNYSGHPSAIPRIVGGVLGGVFGIALLGFVLWFYKRSRPTQSPTSAEERAQKHLQRKWWDPRGLS
ncbi:hypothetical protein DL96DRAFT_1810913 [Flagelloscypha sp. PMI_526]|nr:hypothetical protein DL96DRAFT_1810913 [Flagelloscypha sp. PMI_526]